MLNAIHYIVINYDFNMLIDSQLTKDFVLGAEYDTMNKCEDSSI
jgi:hypothetical protein